MKKKFIRVMFFGALALTTFSYVGCKDYDDDIDRLEQKITENANAIAEINKLIEGGSVITKVENITGGVEVTLSNGKSLPLKMVMPEKMVLSGRLVKTDTGIKMVRKQSSRLKVIKENRALRASRVLQVKTVIPIFRVKTDSGTRMK
jgi:hypothetical protein